MSKRIDCARFPLYPLNVLNTYRHRLYLCMHVSVVARHWHYRSGTALHVQYVPLASYLCGSLYLIASSLTHDQADETYHWSTDELSHHVSPRLSHTQPQRFTTMELGLNACCLLLRKSQMSEIDSLAVMDRQRNSFRMTV